MPWKKNMQVFQTAGEPPYQGMSDFPTNGSSTNIVNALKSSVQGRSIVVFQHGYGVIGLAWNYPVAPS
jgi:hypothetical protein